jgi:outer membrane lipoprotein SlyB
VFQGGGQPGPPPGASQPNLVGAVIYLPLGGDGTTTEKPFVGGVGTPEMRERFRETTYEIAVRLNDGSTRFVQRHDGTRYRVGDRVRLPGAGQIELVVD